MPRSYKELLEQARNPNPFGYSIPLEDVQKEIEKRLEELTTDLEGVELTDADLVEQLIIAKFAESSVLGNEYVAILHGEATEAEEGVVKLGSTIIGSYSKAAFNVSAIGAPEQKVLLFVSPVPPGGNQRT